MMDRAAFVSSVAGCRGLQSRSARWVCAGAARLRRGVAPRTSSASLPTVPHISARAAAGQRQPREGRAKPDAGPYSNTVNLPQTEFSQRANAAVREPELQAMWAKDRVYERLSRENGGDKFVLHDGPPFANGPVHCGHAMNKSLKDFIVRYQLLRGRKAAFVPGWDTHGLPIELKVLQGMKSKERQAASVLDMRKRAAKFALEAVASQAAGFRRFGVWGDWDEPYLTLDPEFEAAQIGVFGEMYLKGYIYRGRKPVHWSPSSRTALAEAELEYPAGHTSKSCYCAFSAVSAPDGAPDEVKAAVASGTLRLSVWTTTPWTMPANRAVAVNSSMTYALVANLDPRHPGDVTVIAKSLVEPVAAKLAAAAAAAAAEAGGEEAPAVPSPRIVAIALGKSLIGIEYSHCLEDGLVCRVVEGGDYITTETGTGLVHTAPGHGQEDYQTGLREGLELVSPVDAAGNFTEEAAGGRFTGLSVLGDGNDAVLAALGDSGVLLLQEPYAHKYPYDWRTKKPTIFRATEQWFASVDGFRKDALDAIEKVQWCPPSGIKRIRGMVEGRGDWCLSRQRTWGLPIPVFYDDETGEAILTQQTVSHIQAIFVERGSNAWWEMENDQLLPAAYRGRALRKGIDTMDVWFDSGTSWASVPSGREALHYPADVYLEGSDQHRGWFQSSLLTSVATRGQAPYKAVLTHGFVLDDKGVKMSKSVGNVVDPLSIVNGGSNKKTDPAYGADVLRLWVASCDYSGDMQIGPQIVRQTSDVYRKLRNTMRYMVGNLHDFDPAAHAVAYADLPSVDQYILFQLQALMKEVQEAYDAYSFYRVYQALQKFCIVDLSNFYLDMAKDRLYIPEPDALRRRSCQTVVAEVLETYARAMAPLLPHMAEDLWQNMPYRPKSNNAAFPAAKSVFEAGWVTDADSPPVSISSTTILTWNTVLLLRDAVNKVLETARSDKLLGASMEAHVTICCPDPVDAEYVEALDRALNDVDTVKRVLIVSGVRIVDDPELLRSCAHSNLADDPEMTPRFAVGVDRATAPKCDRCWHYDASVGCDAHHPLLCDRCADAVVRMGIASQPRPAVAPAVAQ
jgi:isoleucyl-tRNA synthetase